MNALRLRLSREVLVDDHTVMLNLVGEPMNALRLRLSREVLIDDHTKLMKPCSIKMFSIKDALNIELSIFPT